MPIILLLIGAGVGLYILSKKTDLVTTNSENEAMPSTDDLSLIDQSLDPIIDSVGWPYFYTLGSPSTKWESGSLGVDCSGYVLMCLVRLGIISEKTNDMNTATIANECDPVEIGSQIPGDIAYYPGHVMLVCNYPGANGHSAVVGASGGGRTTIGNDPNARVKVFTTAKYRDDFVCYMRFKPTFKYLV
jgi:hypothetical protein